MEYFYLGMGITWTLGNLDLEQLGLWEIWATWTLGSLGKSIGKLSLIFQLQSQINGAQNYSITG